MPKPTFLNRQHANLAQLIRAARCEEEIVNLLAQGSTYEYASPKTRSRWHEAAKARRGEIGHSADSTE